MSEITIHIKRSILNENITYPEMLQEFKVEAEIGESTVLEILQKIQLEMDDSLALRYGCRFRECGLCAMIIDGKPQMACMTKFKDNMVIKPLNKIPVVKDLIVDRKFITDIIQEKEIYETSWDDSKDLITTKKYDVLNKCTDCQSCLSVCSEFDYNKIDDFVGPLFFVKLAQLQNHPRNNIDYTSKAKELGVDQCADCNCRCPYGIPIKKFAMEPFQSKC